MFRASTERKRPCFFVALILLRRLRRPIFPGEWFQSLHGIYFSGVKKNGAVRGAVYLQGEQRAIV